MAIQHCWAPRALAVGTAVRAASIPSPSEYLKMSIGADRVGMRLSPYGVTNDMRDYHGMESEYGLLAGERLYLGLKQLETAYQEKRGHDFEVTKLPVEKQGEVRTWLKS